MKDDQVKTNRLLALLIQIVLDTHNYVELGKYKTKLGEIMND